MFKSATLVGREGDVYVVCRIIVLIFSIFHIHKAVQVIQGLKLNIRNLYDVTMLKKHYFLLKWSSDHIQNMS